MIFSLSICLFMVLNLVYPAPTEDLNTVQSQGVNIRHPRATCEVLAAGKALLHSRCTAHCLVLRRGYTGGQCKNGLCKCS